MKMTIEYIREKLVEMANENSSSAHETEDNLHQEVLRSIANGECENPQACAEEAMKSRKLDFDRWYD